MRLNLPLLPITITIEPRRLQSPRFRIRSLLILVALVAIALFVSRLGTMARDFGARASFHLQKRRDDGFLIETSTQSLETLQRQAETWKRQADQAPDPAIKSQALAEAGRLASRAALAREAAAHWSRRAEYHDQMSQKYTFAAKYPFVPLLPDPREP